MQDRDDLDLQRSEKIKELGILCYNAGVDGKGVPEAAAVVLTDVKNRFKQFGDALGQGADEATAARCGEELDRSLMSAGYMCYNSYVDGQVSNPELVSVCREISDMCRAAPAKNEVGDEDDFDDFPQNNFSQTDTASVTAERPAVASEKFQMNYPFGMEPIPSNYIRCKCGYRNKPFANFCGKCGSRLEGGRHGRFA